MPIESQDSALTERIKAKAKFQKLPQDLQDKIIIFDLDDSEDLINYLCLQAQALLCKGLMQQGKCLLELAEEIAIESGDNFVAAQIGTWLILIESKNQECVAETVGNMREAINFTVEYQQFEKESK